MQMIPAFHFDRQELAPLAVDHDGGMFVVRGPGSSELSWIGDLDEILASIVA